MHARTRARALTCARAGARCARRWTSARVVFIGFDFRRLDGFAGVLEVDLPLRVPVKVRVAARGRLRPRVSV